MDQPLPEFLTMAYKRKKRPPVGDGGPTRAPVGNAVVLGPLSVPPLCDSLTTRMVPLLLELIRCRYGRRCMLVSVKPSADFSRWCAHPATRPRISATHPHHRAIRKSLYASTSSPVILATADSYSLPHYLVARHESKAENRPFPNPY